MENKAPIKIHIVRKTVFSIPDKGRASKTAASQWQVWPAIQVAKPGDIFEWEIKDHHPHKLTIHLPGEFEPATIEATGHKATARLGESAGKAQHLEYEVYVDDVFAHGLSSPGIIID